MNDTTKKEIKRLSKYFKIEADELINEAWLIAHDNPGIADAELHRKLNSYCVEISKINGIRGFCDSMDDADLKLDLAGNNAHTASVFDELIENSDRAEREAKYEQINLLKAVEGYASAAEMSRALGCSERDMRRWLEKQISTATTQAEIFN